MPRGITSAALDAALADMTQIEGEERATAESNLTKQGVEATEANLKLYVAMRRIREPNSRICADLLKKWEHKAKQEFKVKQAFWLVPNGNSSNFSPAFSKTVAEMTMDPSQVAEEDCDLSAFIIVDQAIPQKDLGKGVRQVELSVSLTKSMNLGATSGRLRISGDNGPKGLELAIGNSGVQTTPMPRNGAQTTLLPVESPASSQPQVAIYEPGAQCIETDVKANRNLRPRISNDSEASDSEQQEAAVGKRYIVEVKDAFMNQRAHCADLNQPGYAHFICRKYITTLRQKAASLDGSVGGKKLHELLAHEMVVFPKYVVASLLLYGNLETLPFFVQFFEDAAQLLDQPASATARGVLQLHSFDLRSDSELVIEGLNAKQSETFFASPLYGNFVVTRVAKRIEALMNDTAKADRDRCDRAAALHKQATTDEQKSVLAFAMTYYSPTCLCDDAKVVFLMAGENLKHLAAWSPEDRRLVVRCLNAEGGICPTMSVADYIAAAKLVVDNAAAVEAIKNDTVKSLVRDFKSFLDVDRSSDISAFAQMLFLNLSSCRLKLGSLARDPTADDAVMVMLKDPSNKGKVKQCMRILGANVRRMLDASTSRCWAIETLLQASEDITRAEAAAKENQATQKLADAEEKGTKKSSTASCADTGAQGTAHSSAQGEGGPNSVAVDFEPGAVVMTKSGVHKEKFNNIEAKVIRATKNDYIVQLLTGPCAGQEKKITKANIYMPATAHMGAALPAVQRGLKRKAEEDPIEQARQAEASAQLAKELLEADGM